MATTQMRTDDGLAGKNINLMDNNTGKSNFTVNF